jgi:hypothetical protein
MGMFAKGSTIRTTLDFLRRERGGAAVERILDALPAASRARVLAAGPTDEVPYALATALWRAADAELGADDPQWMERAGAHSIESLGIQLYSGILRKASPTEFLTQSVSLFRLYYHPGDMEVVEQGAGRAVLRLVGFEAGDPLFCRRQLGGLRQAIAIAGGSDPQVRHVRCETEGDAFCEWELRWT